MRSWSSTAGFFFDMETYIKRRRGPLREYLEDHREDLLRGEGVEAKHSEYVHNILWWAQDGGDKMIFQQMSSGGVFR